MEVLIFQKGGRGYTRTLRFDNYSKLLRELPKYRDSFILMTKPEYKWIDWVAFYNGKAIDVFATFNEAHDTFPDAKIGPAPEGAYLFKKCRRELPNRKFVRYVKGNL